MFNPDSDHGFKKYLELREMFPVFIYRGFNLEKGPGSQRLSFCFEAGDYIFKPVWHLYFGGLGSSDVVSKEDQVLAFHLGLAEMISYWKAFCSPRILIGSYELSDSQQMWWTKLFIKGLGEFFYTNGIPQPGSELLGFEYSDMAVKLPVPATTSNSTGRETVLVPVGGGKDSAVGAEILLPGGYTSIPFVINPRGATDDVIREAGFDNAKGIRLIREIDPLLLKLNERGFLNGHTPFSALLAFASFYAARQVSAGHIALSNESSANEPSIPGTGINHQYSKSLEFESDFRQYVCEYLGGGSNYFSLLRPLNELQIAAIFSGLKQYHRVFRSCNAGSKENAWCCRCPKCLFTYIILSPFLQADELKSIFGSELYTDMSLRPLLDQLCGIADSKPLECVGTTEEVNVALQTAVKQYLKNGYSLPPLLEYYHSSTVYSDYRANGIKDLLGQFDPGHCLLPEFEYLVRIKIRELVNDPKIFA